MSFQVSNHKIVFKGINNHYQQATICHLNKDKKVLVDEEDEVMSSKLAMESNLGSFSTLLL